MALGTSMCLALRVTCGRAKRLSCRFVEPWNFQGSSIPAVHQNKKAPQGGFFILAERQGFEPWNTCEDVTGIPVQRLRPLGHLSG